MNKQREIKFRVWSLADKCLMNHCAILDCQGKLGSHFFELNDKHELIREYLLPLDGEKYVIQQYIGLKDKNNKEIYEGDIIKSPITMFGITEQIPLEVKYDKTSFEAFMNNASPAFPMIVGSALFNCEVIGNIFENPELLK